MDSWQHRLTCLGLSNWPDDHFAPIEVRLLRASEFEAPAAASLHRLAATVQEGRSGRSQALGKPCGVRTKPLARRTLRVRCARPAG
jgi:hypothetical protein